MKHQSTAQLDREIARHLRKSLDRCVDVKTPMKKVR
jgi:hypothetical protein